MLYKGRGYTHFKILETESVWNTSPGIGSSMLTTPALVYFLLLSAQLYVL